MEMKATLRAMAGETRGYLRMWAEDFSEDAAREPPRDLGHALYEVTLNENHHVGQVSALRKRLGKARGV